MIFGRYHGNTLFDILRNYVLHISTLTLCQLGGGQFDHPLDISRRNSETRNGLATQFHEFFSFKYRATFETKFVVPAHTVFKPRPFEKISSSPKLLKNVILCTNAIGIEFSHRKSQIYD